MKMVSSSVKKESSPAPANSSSSSSAVDKEEEKVSDEYQLLCRELNMDSNTIKSAWESYLEIKKKYTLEVNIILFANHVDCVY